MRVVRNAGTDRVIDGLAAALPEADSADLATNRLSLFAWAALQELLGNLDGTRILIPSALNDLGLLGDSGDRAARNRLETRHLARSLAEWLDEAVELRLAPTNVPQGIAVTRKAGSPNVAMLGSFGLTTGGLGLSPDNPMNFVQTSETPEEAAEAAGWFDEQWAALPNDQPATNDLIEKLEQMAALKPPALAYAAVLNKIFGANGDLDDEAVIKSATGIRETIVWQKLYKFQRDGVVAAIDKLNRFGGCIIADSVGLGKTFEALAVIKYHELRNDRVLVLCPKRLRENWTMYAANDRRNPLADDRLNYDVLNHTDLSRDRGQSGDIDLANVNWGNYDLVVIDESHNFRNKQTPKQGGETRYDRLLRQVVKEGVKTRVLMLSATPVNNRLADLRNQIAFATEGDDKALASEGIASVEATTRRAQAQFNRWLKDKDGDQSAAGLVESLGFDYFTLLDRLTIARSRRHIEKYYGTEETGRFPERLKPINVKADIDLSGDFPPIGEINKEIRKLHLAAYAPLQYVLPEKRDAYDKKYSVTVQGKERTIFRQADREQSMIHLMRVNLLKRLESAVSSFALTLERQIQGVNTVLAKLDSHDDQLEELDLDEIDLDDPAMESLVVGRKVKVLLTDVDLIRWRQDLQGDRNRLETLLSAAQAVTVTRDAKLAELKKLIAAKSEQPINGSNKKVIVFTHFADTATYLYEALARWAKDSLGIDAGLVKGSGTNETTIDSSRTDMASILTMFAPRAKERPDQFADEGNIDLLIATDCVSEGQNLQDCDWLVNYDIHWNPVRIIQRFGRIDRLGSTNESVQLVNFWPNMELEEYIDLEQRVSGRMKLLDVSATGEENLIEQQSGDPMNDLAYRRSQMEKLQNAVIDIEDLDSGVSITDLTLNDFRIDLAEYRRAMEQPLEDLSLGVQSAVSADTNESPVGAIFCLQAVGQAADPAASSGYPLFPFYLAYVGADEAVVLPFTQVHKLLGQLKSLCHGRDQVDQLAAKRLDKATKNGVAMSSYQELLSTAIDSIRGKSDEKAVASLFVSGGTHARAGEIAGSDDFEVIAMLAVLPGSSG